MRYVPTAAEMRGLDRATIEDLGLPGAVLMENAGRAVADAVIEELVAGATPPVAIVCGAGNNGGDGHVAARWLRQRGVPVTVYLAARRDAVRGDARLHLEVFEQMGGVCIEVCDGADLTEQRAAIESAGVVVDALFGTGLGRPVDGLAAELVAVMNRSAGRLIAVDLPSGLDADRGVPLGCAVVPDRTVTFGFLKPALAVSPGFAECGEVEVAAIGIPLELAAAHGVRLAVLEASDVAMQLPCRDPRDHKSRAGHLLVVAGSPGKRGAGRLAGWAALRAGAGLVTLAAAGDELAAPDPIMTATVDADAADGAGQLTALAVGKRALAIGPGMATGAGGRALVHAALEQAAPVVLDADALNHLAGDVARVAAAPAAAVLTPHPGEAARLLAVEPAEIERDRVAAVRRLAEASRSVVVLKGARTLVCDGLVGDGFVTVNPTGNAGLATAGSGDVLTGVIGGLLAQGVAPGEAARLGVWLHGAAGDLARDALGELSLTASDLADHLPAAIRALQAS
jgi:ADP-dependent NAD(P)H-hydrate dehydratase / NAD(P)H-hydrate epimerase